MGGLPAHRTFWKLDTVSDATRDDADLVRPDQNPAELCLYIQHAVLKDDKEVAVGRVERLVWIHVLARGEDVDAQAALHSGVARAGDQMERVHPVDRLVKIEGVPAELIGNLVDLLVRLAFRVEVPSRVFACEELLVV